MQESAGLAESATWGAGTAGVIPSQRTRRVDTKSATGGVVTTAIIPSQMMSTSFPVTFNQLSFPASGHVPMLTLEIPQSLTCWAASWSTRRCQCGRHHLAEACSRQVVWACRGGCWHTVISVELAVFTWQDWGNVTLSSASQRRLYFIYVHSALQHHRHGLSLLST